MILERLRRVGAEGLSDAELVALLLGGGIGRSVLGRATLLLESHGGLHALAQRGIGSLVKEPGIGEATAARFAAAQELGRRVMARPLPCAKAITRTEQVVQALGPKMAHLDHERVVALALDARHRLLAELTVGQGGQIGCALRPADLIRPLLLQGAQAVILVHNHPSGDPNPSPSDLELTERLASALELVGMELRDHVVLGSCGHFSFRDTGLLRDAFVIA